MHMEEKEGLMTPPEDKINMSKDVRTLAEASEASEDKPEGPVDVIDQAYVAMGGFGRLQWVSYVANTLIQSGCYLFLGCFVFLEKEPLYKCLDEATGLYYHCEPKDFCGADKHVVWDYDYSTPESFNNMIEQLDLPCESSFIIGLLGASFLAGIVIGCLTLTRLGDILGRKPIYILGLCLNASFAMGVVWVTSQPLAFAMIFVYGMSMSSRYYVGYTYNIEMQPKSHYVLVSTTQFLFESITYLFICIYFWKISTNWKALQYFNFGISVFGLIFLFLMPETPRFLISVKRFTEARETLAWIGKMNGLEEWEAQERLNAIVFDGELMGNSVVEKHLKVSARATASGLPSDKGSQYQLSIKGNSMVRVDEGGLANSGAVAPAAPDGGHFTYRGRESKRSFISGTFKERLGIS